MHSAYNGGDYPQLCSPSVVAGDRPGNITIDFCNIRGLKSNFISVEHHLTTNSPTLLLLSEVQLSTDASPDLYQVSNYNLFTNFRSKRGVCAYSNINTPVARLVEYESHDFDIIWLKVSLPTITLFICLIYHSPNSNDHLQLYRHLTTCHESLLTNHYNAEVVYLGDFNAHHTRWLGSSRTTPRGAEAYSFSLLNDLEQIIQHPTRVPDRHDQSSNILDLFLTSKPSHYTYTISAPVGSSDHNLISVSAAWARPPPLPPTKRRLWHFERAQWALLRSFFLDFPWSAACFSSGDSSACCDSIADVIRSGMDCCIPYTLPPTGRLVGSIALLLMELQTKTGRIGLCEPH